MYKVYERCISYTTTDKYCLESFWHVGYITLTRNSPHLADMSWQVNIVYRLPVSQLLPFIPLCFYVLVPTSLRSHHSYLFQSYPIQLVNTNEWITFETLTGVSLILLPYAWHVLIDIHTWLVMLLWLTFYVKSKRNKISLFEEWLIYIYSIFAGNCITQMVEDSHCNKFGYDYLPWFHPSHAIFLRHTFSLKICYIKET